MQRHDQETQKFLSRVRAPGSGPVAALFSRIERFFAQRAERLAEERFARTLVDASLPGSHK